MLLISSPFFFISNPRSQEAENYFGYLRESKETRERHVGMVDYILADSSACVGMITHPAT